MQLKKFLTHRATRATTISISLVVISIVISCCFWELRHYSRSNPAYTISRYLDDNTNFEFVDTCYIDMAQILEIEYDTLYFFSGITPTEMIAEKMRIPYNNSWLGDDQYRLILVRDDEVVYDRDMSRSHCNWHLPEGVAITQSIFMVTRPYDRYELTPKNK